MADGTIRNIAVAGHAGSGKTLLAEAMMTAMGVIPKPGDSPPGTTHSDFDPEEQRRRHSLQTSLLSGTWQGITINVLDTPGHPDFWGDAQRALRAADAVLLVLDATKGFDVVSARIWQEAGTLALPVFVVVTHGDAGATPYDQTVRAVADACGAAIVAVTVPVAAGVADLLASRLDGGADGQPLTAAQTAAVATPRTAAVEAAVEQDDGLLERYLDGGTLAPEELWQAWRQGVIGRRLFPAFAVTPPTGVGIRALLDAIVALGPTPSERPPLTCQDPATGETWTVAVAGETVLCGWIFKTFHDPYAGKISLFRLFSGTLRPDETVWDASRGHAERVGRLFRLVGKDHVPLDAVGAGDIAAVAKLKDAQTGDTLLPPGLAASPFVLEPPPAPPALYAVAITPQGKGDENKLGSLLHRLREDDPDLAVSVEPGTHRTVIGGAGPTHVEIALHRLTAAGIALDVSAPRIPYRETVTAVAQAQGKHKKQTGGHGQYGDVWLRLEPLSEGQGYAFASEVVGGAIPKALIPAVDKGIQESLAHGPLIGAPVVDVRAVVFDGSAHSVDSSEMAFKLAAHLAFKKAFAAARPILLEPLLHLAVTVPEALTGDVISDLTTRRARIQGIDTVGHHQVVRALAPMAEVVAYAPILTSLTRGTGSYTATFAHYEPVPPLLQDKLIAAHADHALAA